MTLKKTIENDIGRMRELFPKLLLISREGAPPCFQGEIDICDVKGVYWDTFNIKILAPVNYPFGVPLINEIGLRIERIADRHISNNGYCCVAVNHVLLHHAANRLTIADFTEQYIYPYFANQLYFDQNGRFADQEYLHGFQGIQQFYKETLNSKNLQTSIKLLEYVLEKKSPPRNSHCFCEGGKKFKNCHLFALEYLGKVDVLQLNSDLDEFERLLRHSI
ncbi:hypothetical protein [Arcticibacter sp. MXS-1]|uniref:hypothetical protein n=1 Tax=Arcticibacter sp. MXS-1 TaxID=3341726 RepID=UPI0035A9745F